MTLGSIQLERIKSEDDDINASLHPYEVLTYPADYTLEVLVDKTTKEQIRITPFQRHYIWTQEQASKLIESFLLGLPVPPIFLYTDEDNRLIVVDGQQRLQSIVYFFGGIFRAKDKLDRKPSVFTLVGLHDKSPYLGMTYRDIESNDAAAFNRLLNSVLRAFVIKQLQPKGHSSIFQVFERLNTGGVVLQGQEIRNCIFEGPFNDLLLELNQYEGWRDILGTKRPDKRMRDIELVLRFFAVYFNVVNYEKPMKKFLNDFMELHKKLPNGEYEQFKTLFKSTADTIIQTLGKRPFHIRRGLNTAAYDSVFTAFAQNLDKFDLNNPDIDYASSLRSRYEALTNSLVYQRLISNATTDKDVVKSRLTLAQQVLFNPS
jgi:hypothetical protein